MKQEKFIIATGGTGGHIYPAISVANTLKEALPNAEILFVGAENRMEMTKVPKEGYKIVGLKVSGMQRKLSISNFLLIFKIIAVLLKANRLINTFKPQAVIGFGGYASFPVVLLATFKGIPTIIQEQNSYAGLANKILSKRVKKICVAYKGMEKYFPNNKIIYTGNPVRENINSQGSKEKALEYFNLDNKKPTVLVIGGSLGARTINNSILRSLKQLHNSDVQLIWQVGKYYYRDIQKKIKNIDTSNIRLFEFISEMHIAYIAADVVVSRSGAIAISELSIVGKPTIFIPSPNVTADHQTINAMNLVNDKAALLIKDSEAEEKLAPMMIDLLGDKKMMKNLSTNIIKRAVPDARKKITNEILTLIK